MSRGADAVKSLLDDAHARQRDMRDKVAAAGATLSKRKLLLDAIDAEVRSLESDLAALTRGRGNLSVVV